MSPRVWSLLVAGSVFALDRATKLIIEHNVSVYDTHSVIPGFFDIVHAKNRGAAFGMFSDSDSQLRTFLLIGVSLAVLCFISMLLLRPSRAGFSGSKLTTLGLALVLGGAIGNIYDRIVSGMVTDFLDFYHGSFHFAAFNVADAAITVGASILLLDMWVTRGETARS